MAKDLKQKHEHAIERVGCSDTERTSGQPTPDLEAYKTRNNDGTATTDTVESSFRRQNKFGGGLSTVQSVENVDTGTDQVYNNKIVWLQ